MSVESKPTANSDFTDFFSFRQFEIFLNLDYVTSLRFSFFALIGSKMVEKRKKSVKTELSVGFDKKAMLSNSTLSS